MPVLQPVGIKPTAWDIGVAAEAFAAGQFARCGYKVSVQYGPNQPEYDLIVDGGQRMTKVSVKGSQDWGWGLAQGYLTTATKISGNKADYQGAISLWLAAHDAKIVFCLVQFGGITFDKMPNIYLATLGQIATELRKLKNGRGDVVLNEDWTLTRGPYSGSKETLPAEWHFTPQRIIELFVEPEAASNEDVK